MRVRDLPTIASCIAIVLWTTAAASGAWTNNIMVTGYWSPTNTMLAKFSTDAELNPGGWMGENWQNGGYDIYAYFPVFGDRDPVGTGDFTVDYQDTSADFWRVVEEIHPVAILGYGQGAGPWELEYNAVNRSTWLGDYEAPTQPDASPPDGSVPADYVRHSTLPVQEIADAINEAGLGVDAWIDWTGDPGDFLCNYMAYHISWYQSLHNESSDPYQCLAAGFTHVGVGVTLEQATTASDIALRTTIEYMTIPEPSTLLMTAMGLVSLLMYVRKAKSLSGTHAAASPTNP